MSAIAADLTRSVHGARHGHVRGEPPGPAPGMNLHDAELPRRRLRRVTASSDRCEHRWGHNIRTFKIRQCPGVARTTAVDGNLLRIASLSVLRAGFADRSPRLGFIRTFEI